MNERRAIATLVAVVACNAVVATVVALSLAFLAGAMVGACRGGMVVMERLIAR